MLITLGAGGVALDVIEIARSRNVPVVACVDDTEFAGSTLDLLGVPIYRSFRRAVRSTNAKQFVVAIGDNFYRERSVWKIQNAFPELELSTLIHSDATVSEYAHVGSGSLVMAGARVEPLARIEALALLYQNTVVSHDCQVGSAVSLAAGAVLGGSVIIGARTSMGLNSSAREKTRIGADCVVGAAAYVRTDLPQEVVAVGVPARAIRGRTPGEPYLQ